MKKCPNCHKEYPDSYNYCVDCSTPLDNPEKKNVCKRCGADIEPGRILCDSCRSHFVFGKSTSIDAKRIAVIGMISAGLFLMVFLFGLIIHSVIFNSRPDGPAEQEAEMTTEISDVTEETTQQVVQITETATEAPEVITEDPNKPINIALKHKKYIEFGPVEYDGHAYAVINFDDHDANSFKKCKKLCKKLGGHIAVINGPEENEFLHDYLVSIEPESMEHTFFGYRKHDDGWKWVDDGTKNTYENWDKKADQPNNLEGNEDTAQFYSKKHSRWNDENFGESSYRILCEWE